MTREAQLCLNRVVSKGANIWMWHTVYGYCKISCLYECVSFHSNWLIIFVLISWNNISHQSGLCLWLSFVTDVMYRIVFKLCATAETEAKWFAREFNNDISRPALFCILHRYHLCQAHSGCGSMDVLYFRQTVWVLSSLFLSQHKVPSSLFPPAAFTLCLASFPFF